MNPPSGMPLDLVVAPVFQLALPYLSLGAFFHLTKRSVDLMPRFLRLQQGLRKVLDEQSVHQPLRLCCGVQRQMLQAA